MASSRSSRLSFYDQAGAWVSTPVEGQMCSIVIDVPKELQAYITLKLGGELLQVYTDESGTRSFCIWPESRPGHYELSLSCGAIREIQAIMVMPRNFTREDCMALVNDLTVRLPGSIASQLVHCGAQLAIAQQSSVESEWMRLRNAIVGTEDKLGLLQVLPIIDRECHQILSPRIEVRKAEKLRRPEMSRLPQAMSMPGNMVAEDELYQMFDVAVEQSFETYENQLVKTYVQAVRSRLARLHPKIQELAPPEVLYEFDALNSEFQLACTRANFLRKVKRHVTAERTTMVLLKNPAYRAVFEGYIALNQQSSVTLEEQALTEPLDKFPFLYQLWANLMVMNSLLQVGIELGYQCVSHHWVKSYKKGAFIQVINDGSAALQLFSPTTGAHVNLLPWRPVRLSAQASPAEAPMALAIAIEVPHRPLVVLLFDPKYRVAERGTNGGAPPVDTGLNFTSESEKLASAVEPLQADIDELLICIQQLAEGGEREIQYAALLYPGLGMQIAGGVDALSARPAQGEALHNALCTVIRHYLV
ncbi:MAG TPA: DUF2357 domain-containing protein [Drouetiella sp.]|jgi:Domain of unknown function (DUF2357)